MERENVVEEIEKCNQKINVTHFGADPTGICDSTEAIWRAFESAKEMQGLVVIDFPHGIYQLHKGTAQKRNYHTSNTDSMRYPLKHIALLLEGQEQVILNGNGSQFMIHGDCMAIAIVRSKEVYLYNFSWDFAVPTTAEMTVVAIGEEDGNQYTDFSIPSCFSFSVDDNDRDVTWTSELDPVSGEHYWTNKNQKDAEIIVCYHPDKNITRSYVTDLGPLSERRSKVITLNDSMIRVFYGDKRPLLHQQDVIFEIRPTSKRDTAGAFIWESSETFIEKVAVHYMHGFGWLTQMSHNVSYIDCTFKTKEGSGTYTSSFADSIHVSGASGHIQIEGCTFNHAHDDAINIHGTFTRVEEQIDDRTLRLRYVHRQQGGFPQYYCGNQVVFYRRDTLAPVMGLEKQFTVIAVSHPGEEGNDLQSMTVTFDQSIPSELLACIDGEPLVVAENVTYTPSVHIKNNHFEAIPTRGILCTTRKKVVIEHNTFRHMALDAIFISNDSQDWYESGPVRDVTIRSNTFFVPKVGRAEARNAAIRIHPITKGNTFPSYDHAIHQNIRIEDNHFFMEHESVLVANSVNQLYFTNNNVYAYKPNRNEAFAKTIVGELVEKEYARKTFELTACQQVNIKANTFEGKYRPSLSYVQMQAENIKEDLLLGNEQ
ncbi:hypothetical protein [Sporosarcina sp. YIM B06819]|uniref:right-handed parallel beta-helix repeat-containing protein n=1 Tax=Sporosarcina sp. YIM B06819 TaxID=3081769 RepID=UPI00298D5374|nr:hypothetical protein [Sporosarcina sp. YIM B06819]